MLQGECLQFPCPVGMAHGSGMRFPRRAWACVESDFERHNFSETSGSCPVSFLFLDEKLHRSERVNRSTRAVFSVGGVNPHK